MSANTPVAVALLTLLTLSSPQNWGVGGAAPAVAAPALPTVVLFPRTVTSADDGAALADVRKQLRRDGTVDVLTFDPAGGAFKRAAADAKRPDWLTPALDDAGRASVTRGVGAQFYATIGRGDRGRADIRLVDAGGSGHAWVLTGEKTDDAARHLETDMAGAIDYSLALTPSAAAPVVTVLPAAPAPRITIGESKPPPAPNNGGARQVPTPAPAPIIIGGTASASPNSGESRPPQPPNSGGRNLQAPVSVSQIPAVPVRSTPSVTELPPPKLGGPGGPPSAPAATSPAQALPNIVPPAPPVAITVTPPPPPVTPPVKTSTPPVTITIKTPAPAPVASPVSPTILPGSAHTAPTRLPLGSHSLPTHLPLGSHSPSATVLLAPPAAPARVPDNAPPAPTADDLRAAAAATSAGDDALSRSDALGAIAAYRQAVNAVPLSPAPRVRLARAYLKAEMPDRALDEGRRALLLAPQDAAVQALLSDLDAVTGTSDGAVARATAALAQTPDIPAAHTALGDALWSNGQTPEAETAYRDAVRLSPAGSAARTDARAHLARLYAAQSRYADCLAALRDSGRTGYALALTIVQTRADLLAATLDTARAGFDTGKTTHEAFYNAVNDAAAQAVALSGFVSSVVPPPSFSLSHAHRILATQLLAQQASVLVSYVETGSGTQAQRASELEKAAQTEMLTAHAAETTLGLWNAAQSANN